MESILRPHASAALLVAASCLFFVSAGKADRFIDPEFVDCADETTWHGNGSGGGGTTAAVGDLDQDGRYGPTVMVGMMTEDGDGDQVYGTIAAAITAATAGETIWFTVPGVYHVNISVSKSLTFRAIEGIEVVFDGACGPIGPGITVPGVDNVQLILENITVRNWLGTGITHTTATAGGGGTLTLLNSTIELNVGVGLNVGEIDDLRVEGARIWGNTLEGVMAESDSVEIINSLIYRSGREGLEYTGMPTGFVANLQGSKFINNGAITAASGILINPSTDTIVGATSIDDCTVSRNTVNGIEFLDGVHTITVNDTTASLNTDDGLKVDVSVANTTLVVTDSRMDQNGSDGISLADGGEDLESHVWQSSASRNGAFGIAKPATVTMNCNYVNVFGLNPSGAVQNPAGNCNPLTQTAHIQF